MSDLSVKERATVPALQAGRTPEFFIEKIKSAFANGVAAFVEVGRLLLQAKEELRHGQFGDMVEQDLPFGQRTADMLMAIAKNPVLSNRNHGSNLPPSWRTLYELTRLPTEVLEEKIVAGTIHPGMERKDALALVPNKKTKQRAARPDLLATNRELRAELDALKAHTEELEATRESTTLTSVREQYADLLRGLTKEERQHELKELRILIERDNPQASLKDKKKSK